MVRIFGITLTQIDPAAISESSRRLLTTEDDEVLSSVVQNHDDNVHDDDAETLQRFETEGADDLEVNVIERARRTFVLHDTPLPPLHPNLNTASMFYLYRPCWRALRVPKRCRNLVPT